MPHFERKVLPNKVLMLMGARRVGKTKLIQDYLKNVNSEKLLFLNGDDISDAELLKDRTVANYKQLLSGIDILAIDEAQHIPDIGLILKLIVDFIEGIKVIATGSSIFDLANNLGEPLVGRKNTLYLYPLAQIEFSKTENFKQTTENLEQRLIYGSYPELEHYSNPEDKKDYLFEIVNSYLLKDILMYEGVRNSAKIYDLLKLIAFQVGKEVSMQELGNRLQISKNTVERYLDLLSKVFVLYRLGGFNRNLRKEVTKMGRWYFYDNGIRNAVINSFNSLNMRNDVGELWENYLVSERLKNQEYNKIRRENYFWRTYDQQEIDWLEADSNGLYGFEFKWSKSKKSKIPAAFERAYPNAEYEVINRKNYLQFITKK